MYGRARKLEVDFRYLRLMRGFPFWIVLLLINACGPADNRPTEFNGEAEPGLEAEPLKGEATSTVAERPDHAMAVVKDCQYDNASSVLGIGLVLAPAEFVIYDDASLKDVFTTVDLYADDEGHRGICPRFYGPEYGIMQFVCVDSTADAYKILTDYSTAKYVTKKSGVEFKTWTKYIMDSFGIRRERGADADVPPPIKREPSEASASITIPVGHEMFCPIEVRGDWVKVKYDCFYNLEQNLHEGEPCHNFIGECDVPLTGWVRWRKGNKLLIEIFLMP